MLYQITAPPTAAPDKQADELIRLLKHSKTLTVQFVTVAGGYKPARARLVVLSAPDKFAEQAARVMAVISGREDATRPSQAVKLRPEWKNVALLLPTDPDAPAIDGVLLDGWDSAFLTVTYRPGRVLGRLLHCSEDSERVAALKLDGWQLIAKPNPLQLVAHAAGRPWNGVPSFTPVPGGVALPTTSRMPSVEREVPATIDAPAPLHEEIKGALTDSSDGFLLGVTPEGNAVRLARRAMTLAVRGPQEARQRAVLALLRRGMQTGMGMIVIIDRTLLPTEALQAWEARVRLLDVQNITDSSAIPWREIAPDLLAQAIGGLSASLPALPSRFGAVLDTLGAESLRVPAVLGLATMPGDNLRGALAAGGMVVVPQDGDAASTIVARLLMAYLATPPAIGRGLLILADSAIVPPEALRQQAIQVVVGERSDALLRLGATDTGWRLCTPDGSAVAELLPDFMAQPTEGAGDMVDSIVRDIGIEALDAPAVAAVEEVAPIEAMPVLLAADVPVVAAVEEIAPAVLLAANGLADEDTGWWSSGERTDDLDITDEEPTDGTPITVIKDETPAALAIEHTEPVTETGAEMAPAEVVDDLPVEPLVGTLITAIEDMPATGVVADEEPASDLDIALGSLLQALMTDVPMDATEELIQATVAGEDFAAADAAALAWLANVPQLARPWIWRVVLVEEDTDRAVAAWRAMHIDPEGTHVELVRAVLDAMDAAETAAWLAGIGDEVPGELIDEEPQPDDLNTVASIVFNDAEVEQQDGADLPNVADWPITINEVPVLVKGGERGTPPAETWEALEPRPIAAHALPDADHVEITLIAAAPQQQRSAAPVVLPAIAESPASAPVAEPAQAATVPTVASEDLSDEVIRAIWKSGESVPQLVARLVASGVDVLAARARVRAIINARPTMMAAELAARPASSMNAIPMPAMLIQAPPIPTELGVSPNIPAMSMGLLMPEPVASLEELPAVLANTMNDTTMPAMAGGEIDDERIWQLWQAGTKTDDISIAICGKRGGPKADAARDRMYSVVIPRIVADLDCDDLVDRIAAGEPATTDPRYPKLMKRLARSENAPVGNLERSLIKRLTNARQEV